MSTITLTLTTTTVTVEGAAPLTLTASVTNSATVPARIVLAAFAPTSGVDGTTPASAKGWATIERPLREVTPGATEQYTITLTVPGDAAVGEHVVRFIAYDNDRPPEEYGDQARQVQVIVPTRTAAVAPGTPWWIWVAAAALVLVVGVVAYLALRPIDEPPLPSPAPTSASPTPTPPTAKPTNKPTKILPTKFLPTKKITKVTIAPTGP